MATKLSADGAFLVAEISTDPVVTFSGPDDAQSKSSSSSQRDVLVDETLGVRLRPHACALGQKGRLPRAIGDSARGVWLGELTCPSLAAQSFQDAASGLAKLLQGMITLQGHGLLLTSSIGSYGLRFVPSRFQENDEVGAAAIVAEALEGPAARSFQLKGSWGQILSHRAHLWLRPAETGYYRAMLRLEPTGALLPVGAKSSACSNRFVVEERGPLGVMTSLWQEVPLIEHPHLLRLTMGDGSTLNPLEGRGMFLVDEEEEQVVIHVWRRIDAFHNPCDVEDAQLKVCDSGVKRLQGVEELLWYDLVAALSETKPCLVLPVPAARLIISDEGLTTQDEFLGTDLDSNGRPKQGCAEPEDAPRLASLAFLRQSVPTSILKEEAAPHLFASTSTSDHLVRVLSATLEDATRASAHGTSSAIKIRPKTIDDLFSDKMDFRIQSPWSRTDTSKEEDPLSGYELTSVMLISETPGFVLSFHCLQGVDPCVVAGIIA